MRGQTPEYDALLDLTVDQIWALGEETTSGVIAALQEVFSTVVLDLPEDEVKMFIQGCVRNLPNVAMTRAEVDFATAFSCAVLSMIVLDKEHQQESN